MEGKDVPTMFGEFANTGSEEVKKSHIFSCDSLENFSSEDCIMLLFDLQGTHAKANEECVRFFHFRNPGTRHLSREGK